ncbi:MULTISPECIES: Ig-like domain-containing protein [Providencia]|uniref:Ig-like domain-containing protein n=1 Tax=Providencia huaxiensis TaxID=2027290 RepID=A0ABU2IT11_9GAMM|nr:MULTISPECIES: Ig-like domain-containing protein [Providencia]MBZ3682350.1 Ig-like domain repeat protein [Providencia rettgeri]MDT0132201.1 Ig-like domain-containing protein [Providencia huaxiensis]MDT1978607.1 Ig-like domain-containing protein [Providencia huaxiensis]QLR01731.1 Ig-like domain repeat protein [Providencia rettgeri]
MTDKTITDKLKSIEIQKFKVQGFDLIVTKPDGSIENIKNGLSEVILGNMTLLTEQGTIISQDEILSSITLNVGADAVYIKEQLTSDIVEYTDNQASKNNSEQIEGEEQQDGNRQDDEQSFNKKLAELNQKNQQLEKTLQTLSSEKDEKEALLSSSLTKLTEAKKQLNQKNKSEKAPVEDNDLSFSPPPAPVAMPISVSSSSTQSANKPPAASQIDKPITQVFIQGKLSEESDSGKKGDNITHINTPTFTGVVSPDSQAYLTINDKKYPITADKDGKWLLKITEPLDDKIYEYSLVASSVGGKPVMVNGQFEVDTQLDNLSVSLDGHSDIETLGGRQTNNQVPTFAGKAEAGSSVTLTIAGQILSTVADDKGGWRITVEKPLADGVSDYQVTAVDAAGNQKTITETVTIKTSLPDASVLLDNSAVFLTNKVTPTLTGKTDPNASIIVKVAEKEYFTKANAQGDWSLTINNNLTDGSYVLKVKVTDSVGNQGIFIQSLLVDTTPPPAQAKLRESCDSGVKGDNITQQEAVILEGETKPQSTVVVQFAGQEYSVIADKDGHWQVPLPAVKQDGVYDFHVKVIDTLGNIGASEGQFTVDTKVDRLSVYLEAQSDSGNIGDNITKETRPHFTGKAEVGSRIELTIDGQQLKTFADSHGDWAVAAQKALADGIYHYEVAVMDVAGNTTIVTESVQIKTTLQPTILQLNNQSDFVTNQLTPTLLGQSEPHAKIEISLSGQKYSMVADEQGAWSFMATSLVTSGSYPLKVLVTDIAGNSEKISETVWVDTTPPVAQANLNESCDSGIKGDNITQQKTVTLEGKTKSKSTVAVQFAGLEYSATADKDGYWQIPLPAVKQDGVYDYQVKVTDIIGNVETSKGQFTVDSHIILTAGLDPASQENSNALITYLKRPQISGTSDPESKITAEFKGQTKIVYADHQGKWSLIFDVDANVGKDNHYKVVAEDTAGNQNTISQSFTYLPPSLEGGNAELPALIVTLDAACDSGNKGDYITNIKAPKFTGIATPGAKITLVIGNESFPTVADKVTGNWEVKVKELEEGNSQYLVTAEHPVNGQTTDVSGNIFIDTTAPVSTIELSAETDTGTKGNFITAHRNPVFTGRGEPGCKVILQLNNELVPTTADNNGKWSLKLSNELPKNFIGDYKITVTDAADNQFEKIDTLIINSNPPEITDAALASPWTKGKFHDDKSTNDLEATFTGKVTPGSSLQFKFRLSNTDEHAFSITDIDKDGNWSFSLPSGLLRVDCRYDLDNMSLIATSPAGLKTEKVIEEKGIQIKDCVLNVTFEVAAESSSTGEIDNSLSSSRSPKLQGVISGATDRDELSATILICGKTYSVNLTNGRKNWDFKVPADIQLPLGEVPYTLTFKDVYGSVREFSSSVIISDFKFYLDPDTDSGEIGNHYTNHKKPVYKGQITAGGTISAKVNGHNYPIQANDKGEWRFEVPIKGDGAYHISFIQDDGTVSVGQTTLNILTTEPVFNGFGFVDKQFHAGTQVANVTNPKLVFTYRGNMDYYLINVNGKTTRHNKLQTKYNGSKTVFANGLALPDGEHVAKITAFDIAGNKTEHEVVIKVLSDESGKTAPSIEFGVNDKQLISEKDGKLLFNQNDLTLTGTTSVASLVTIKDINGKILGAAKANNQGIWQIQLPNDIVPVGIQDGENIKLSVTAKDLVNRETQFEFDLVYDISPPELTAELDDPLSSGGIIHVSQPTFSGTTKVNSEVRLTINGKTYHTTAGHDGNWQIKLSDTEALAEGAYSYEIEARDILGQISLQPILGDFTVKTIALAAGGLTSDSDSGIQDDNHTNVNTPTFSGITEPNAEIRLVFDNKVSSTFETIANEKGEWTLPVDIELSDGLHDYVIFANDKIQGIKGQVSGQLVIDTLAPDYLLGGVVDPVSFTTQQDILTDVSVLTFAGIAEPETYVRLTIGQQVYKDIKVNEGGEWAFTLPHSLKDADYNYLIEAIDIAGNIGVQRLTGTVTVDATPPEITECSLDVMTDSGLLNDAVTNHNHPTFSGVTEPNALVEFTINQKTYQESANEKGVWTIPVTEALNDGSYDYLIKVKDKVGHSAEKTGKVMIDTKAAELSGNLDDSTNTADKQDEITSINTPKFSGVTEADTMVFLTIDNQTYKQKSNEVGQWEISMNNPLKDGIYDYEVNVYDQAGNQAQVKSRITIYSDLPDATVTPKPVDNIEVNQVDIPPIDSTLIPIDIDNHYF